MLARRRGWLRGPGPDEDLFGRALDATHSPRLITAADGRALFTNSAFRALFGDEPHAPLRALGIRIRGGVNGPDLFERLTGAIESGEPRRAEALFETTDGRTSWFGVTASPIAGYPGHLLWSLEDATARREMEQVVQDEQQRLFQFFEHAPVGFYVVEADGRLRHINRALAEWLGTSPEAVNQARARLHDFIQGPVPAGAAPYDPFGAGGSVAHGEVLLRGRGGRAFRAEIRQAVSGLGAGLRARAVVRNLTHEREVEDALRRSEWRFRKFAENAPVGVALLDLEGRVIEHNKALAAMAGREALGGVPLTELVRETDRAEVAGRIAEAANGAERGVSVDARFAGERAPAASFYMSRVERDDGTALGLSLHVLDMTEQKNLEVQFAHAQKMQAVGQLAGGIAHDFNNVLTAMIGFCDLLLLRHRPGEQSFADIMHIKQNSNRAASLVRQLLAFSRQQTLQPRVLDLTDVLAELSHLLRRLIGENIELKMIHGRNLGLVRCDQSQFEQVIINLAVNARDAMPSGGTLTIRTSNASHREAELTDFEPVPPGDYVRIDVTDTGMGIPPENLGRIFEPFFSTKEVGSGTGLGLSMVYGIIKQTGGFIFVDSAPDQGAKFTIFLPRHAGQREALPAPASQAEPARQDLSGAGTILLVEDEDPVRTFGARALRNKGYKVYEARTGEAALEVLRTAVEPIDVLVTDVIMPNMDGPTLIKVVRERAPATKIICISGYAEESFRKRLGESTDIRFLPKPFSLNQLAGAVKEVLRAQS